MSPRQRVRLLDVLAEAGRTLAARPSRTVLSMLGTAVGIAALVATVGFVRTASEQVSDRLHGLSATSLQVVIGPDVSGPAGARGLPFDGPARVERLAGVVAASTRSVVGTATPVSALPPQLADWSSPVALPVVAASERLGDVVDGQLHAGRFFDGGHDQRGDPVGVLGSAAARRLRVDLADAVFVDGLPVTVIGILGDAPGDPELLGALIVPDGLAVRRFEHPSPERLLVRTVPGMAEVLAGQVGHALVPERPPAVRVFVQGGRAGVRAEVERDLAVMMVVLGATALVASMFGITNLALVSVIQRAPEIGLRRALGAQRRHIGLQFLAEAGGIGLLGGVVGWSAGVLAAVGVAAARGWTPVLDAWLPAAAVGVGVAVGVLAGAYPALRAARIEPAEAVRR